MKAIKYNKGKKYLEKAGTDIIAISLGLKWVFEPGSTYLLYNDEKLPETFFIESLNKEESLPFIFVRHYKVTHQVDLDRLLRGCSILLTNFTGPEAADNVKNHQERLIKHFQGKYGLDAEKEMMSALMEFGVVFQIEEKNLISINDYLIVAQILGDRYKLWIYSESDFILRRD
ncbi:MAG: hypothetical protein FK734_11810 [Asgard group archaeon]|nr:hypothetical protein [Asgard group archaeon]